MKVPDLTKLTRNPLGIIGLFIWLIYSIAGIVFAVSISDLEDEVQLILVLFIVVFPFAILVIFYRLVTQHHEKLYAPGDFKDERLFFRPATADELIEKQINEVEELESDRAKAGIEPSATSDLKASFLAIESSALDFMEKGFGQSISRDFVTEIEGNKFIFDGVYQDDKRLDLFAVKIYPRPAFKKEFIEAVLYRAGSLLLHESVNNRSRDFRLWLVIVTDFSGDALDEFKMRMRRSVDTNNFDVEWAFIPISNLERNSA